MVQSLIGGVEVPHFNSCSRIDEVRFGRSQRAVPEMSGCELAGRFELAKRVVEPCELQGCVGLGFGNSNRFAELGDRTIMLSETLSRDAGQEAGASVVGPQPKALLEFYERHARVVFRELNGPRQEVAIARFLERIGNLLGAFQVTFFKKQVANGIAKNVGFTLGVLERDLECFTRLGCLVVQNVNLRKALVRTRGVKQFCSGEQNFFGLVTFSRIGKVVREGRAQFVVFGVVVDGGAPDCDREIGLPCDGIETRRPASNHGVVRVLLEADFVRFLRLVVVSLVCVEASKDSACARGLVDVRPGFGDFDEFDLARFSVVEAFHVKVRGHLDCVGVCVAGLNRENMIRV